MKNNTQKFIRENKVWLGIVLVFFLLIAYKGISSGIQAEKEVSVLQEKARLQELEKAPLEQCLNNIDKGSAYEIDRKRKSYQEVRSPEAQSLCMQPTGHGRIVEDLIAAGKMTLREYCWPKYEDEEADVQKILDKAKVDREECYKRYK